MLIEKLTRIEQKYHEIENQLSDPKIIANQEKYQSLAKEYSDLKEIVTKFKEYRTVIEGIKHAQELLAQSSDPELKELAQAEFDALKPKESKVREALELLLVPKDPYEDKNIFLEIRAGTGGEEAALFAGDLLRMYLRYAEKQGFKSEIMEENATGLGGYKEVIVGISGKGAYGRFKYESGTHRVQRVPKTESSGRIHTSAVTVAVLPEADEVDIKIEDKDLRIDTYRASGPGGQNVNKTSSAVRITHVPTGVVVACQDERSQHQNRAKAMRLLRTKLLESEIERQESERRQNRRVQVGSGDRSEKIRTYNYPQSRITDHRIGLSVHNLEMVLDGELKEVIEALAHADKLAKLEAAKK